jgi:thiol-disulfide isomerase/thioredoxin
MNRFWIILACVALCSCSKTETANVPDSSAPSSSKVAFDDSSLDLADAPEPASFVTAPHSLSLGEFPNDKKKAAQAFKSIDDEFQTRIAALKKLVAAAKTKDEKTRLFAEQNPTNEIADRYMELAKTYPDTPSARDAVLFVVGQTIGTRKQDAVALLVEKYADTIKLSKVVDTLKNEIPNERLEKLFHQVIEKASTDEAKANALYGYAKFCAQIPFYKKTLAYNPLYAARLPEAQLEYINRDRTEEELKTVAEALQTVIDKYGDLKFQGGRTYGEVATNELFELNHLQVGLEAPEIEAKDLDGVSFRLSDYRGKVVLLDFWGHWCPPCRAMYDHERYITNKLKDKPFVLLGVNSDTDLDTARSAVRSETLSWRHFWNGEKGTRGPIAATWNIESWPTLYLIDANGIIRYKGVLGEEIDEGIKALLAEMGHDVDLTETAGFSGSNSNSESLR